jgi:hypothetical protein
MQVSRIHTAMSNGTIPSMDFRGEYVFYNPICIELRMQPTSFINIIQGWIFLYASSDTVAYCRLLENGGHSGLSLEIIF